MREIIQYIADDGTVFESEYKCREYEINSEFKEFKGKLLDNCQVPTDSLEEMYYVYLPTIKDVGILENRCDYEGYTSPDDIGYFRYDVDGHDWVNLIEEYERIKKELEGLGYTDF